MNKKRGASYITTHLHEYPSCHRSAVLINDTGYRGLRLSASPPAIIPSHLRCSFYFKSQNDSQYAKLLPLHYANHLALQADEIDASGIGLHRMADSVKKHCPWFSKRLPVKIKNVARSFRKPWATNFNPMGNKFCADGQRILDLKASLYSPFSICS